ncbi:hypothetical protein [Paraburkholderia saeva]|uniref:hypothetical protein n=1 Tax=Paraburkholderia saeva TaxID=2777537 RepID=UPI001D4235F7|nr:hypothetical protein [Paraburkholderia saeva]CAG4887839.1 hypothetical protein R52603_00522 [Paraburkholderia saeva]
MKLIASAAALMLCSSVYAQVIPSERQQTCNELSGIVAAGATWRDNFVPFSVAEANLDRALQDTKTPLNLWGQWTAELAKVYGSKITAEKVQQSLLARCH